MYAALICFDGAKSAAEEDWGNFPGVGALARAIQDEPATQVRQQEVIIARLRRELDITNRNRREAEEKLADWNALISKVTKERDSLLRRMSTKDDEFAKQNKAFTEKEKVYKKALEETKRALEENKKALEENKKELPKLVAKLDELQRRFSLVTAENADLRQRLQTMQAMAQVQPTTPPRIEVTVFMVSPPGAPVSGLFLVGTDVFARQLHRDLASGRDPSPAEVRARNWELRQAVCNARRAHSARGAPSDTDSD